MDYLVCTFLTGVGATMVMDLWAIARQRLFGIAQPNYGLVGRWVAHLTRAHFRHDSIAAAPCVRGERTLGWIVHYSIGVAFAAVLIGLWGLTWVHRPALGPCHLPA